MRAGAAIALGSGFSLAALSAATQFLAAVFAHQSALGAALTIAEFDLYPPWAVFDWRERWQEAYPRPFAVADLILLVGFVLAAGAATLALRRSQHIKPFGVGAWATFDEIREAALFADAGSVLGEFDGELLCFDGPEHQILIGASRSGKGRGHVVPTLLAWPQSALVLDVKGELADGDPRHGFPGTSGFRETLGPVLRFAPTRLGSASFNPLHEVRRGANAVRDGWSITLRGMEGTDPSGASGLRDRTDNHLDRLGIAIGLSAIVSVIADNAEDDEEQSLSQSVGDAAASEAARTGGRIIDRELNIRPTLRIRAGGAVRVLVTRDIELRPYRAR